ncbi:MAG: glutamyl-tRNA reductase [Chloroflexaceae bacterium]|nr:glutamyl-tRNA reductase [Chloroflexaceae bacterium]
MKLFLVGVDHTSAPVEVREGLAFSPVDLPNALAQLTIRNNGTPPLLAEAVLLSTCNRVELYGIAFQPEGVEQRIVEFLAKFHQLPTERFISSLFFYTGEEVVKHLFETSAGLRSLVLGEAQIQGQVRTAYTIAQRVRSTGPALSRLFRSAITTGKRVRHETSLGSGAASVSQAGVELARQRLGSLDDRCVLLVGSGAVSELAAQNLLANGAGELLVVNRTYERGLELAARYGAEALPFDRLVEAMARADIIISSTAAPTTVLHRHHVEAAMQQKAEQCGTGSEAPSLLMIDLAVPRDIDTDVCQVPGVHLHTVDDLHEVVNHTLVQRSTAIAAAQRIVAQEVASFMTWMRSYDTLPTLTWWRKQADRLRDDELKRAMRRLNLSPEEQYIVEAFSRSLVNKLLHAPTLRMKDAASNGEGQRYAAMVRDLWNLQDSPGFS